MPLLDMFGTKLRKAGNISQMSMLPSNEDQEQPTLIELISLNEAAELSGFSASHLRLLVRRSERTVACFWMPLSCSAA